MKEAKREQDRAPDDARTPVFVSRPNVMDADHTRWLAELDRVLAEHSLRPVFVNTRSRLDRAPIKAIYDEMARCQGALVLGLWKIRVAQGVMKAGDDQFTELRDVYYPTPWNQVEAGIAIGLGIPLLVIREPEVSGGVFEADDVLTARSSDAGDLIQWLRTDAFRGRFEVWSKQVHERARVKKLPNGSETEL